MKLVSGISAAMFLVFQAIWVMDELWRKKKNGGIRVCFGERREYWKVVMISLINEKNVYKLFIYMT